MACPAYVRLSVTALVLTTVLLDGESADAALVCAYSKPGVDRNVWSVADTARSTQTVDDLDRHQHLQEVEECHNDVNFCYTLWQYNPIDPMNASLYTILAKGCWDASTDVECRAEHCYSYPTPSRALNNTKFCCCSGQLCNANISEANQLTDSSMDLSGKSLKLKSFDNEAEPSDNGLVMICVAALLCLAFLGTGLAVCCRALSSMSVMGANPKRATADSLHLLESNSSSSQSSSLLCEFDKLNLIEEIGRGRYGSVWKASLNQQTVAVKKFGPQYRHYFLNEKDIYLLPLMECNPCLPRLFGYQELTGADGRLEYHLVLSYAQLGSLQDYLRNNTVDWMTLCRLIQSTTRGLAYLHSETKRGDTRKPCVAHRDLSSRNILVNADHSCMVCDFQFAIRISGSEYYSCGERFDSQTASLNDVGTLRYMAPEILEGAVNLRDCESAMKQIDVYALGLVLWESASRCADLYQGIEVPPYKQPFEHEIGVHPTFEQMQVLVTKNKARPLFPDIWKDSNPAIRALKETIEDCWDPDADARLTALCVEERLAELPHLWERYKNGTLATCLPTIYSPQTLANINNQKNRLKSGSNAKANGHSNSYHNLIVGLDSSDKLSNDLQTNHRYINRLEFPNNNLINSNNNSLTLTDNLVSFGPSADLEKNIVSAANAFVHQPKVTLPLQPHQGRNPCLERNLMMESSDDKPSVLLEHGFKFHINREPNQNRDSHTFDTINATTNESNTLDDNDLLSRTANETMRNASRRLGHGVTPIPILQNAVGFAAMPKQPNVPGNGHSAGLKKTNETICSQTSSESNLSKIVKWTHMKTLKEWAFRRKTTDKCLVEENEPFTRQALSKEDTNIRPVSNSLISGLGLGPTAAPTTPLDSIGSLATEPKVTQRDSGDGSPPTTVIHKSDNNLRNNRISIDFDVLVDKSMGRPSNLNRIHGLEDNSNPSPMTDPFVCKQT